MGQKRNMPVFSKDDGIDAFANAFLLIDERAARNSIFSSK
jgi:hypothetical protein